MSTRRALQRSLDILSMVSLVLLLAQAGCVTRGTWQALQTEHEGVLAERERLETENERLQIERDAYESQFLDAQESLEDERVVRASLASDLETVSAEAASLDESLDAERRAHLAAAAALAARETELASMQSTYDELVGDLEAEVSAGQIEIERLREGLRLNVSEKVLFASGSASLDETGRQVLVKVAERLSNLTDFVEVRGHTDDVRIRSTLAKRYPTNWELAAARAARVVRLLEEQGVPGSRLAVISLGPNEPIASNDTAEGRARNRRIEIRLIPSRSAHSGKRASEPDAPGPEEAEPEAEPAAPQAADARVGG